MMSQNCPKLDLYFFNAYTWIVQNNKRKKKAKNGGLDLPDLPIKRIETLLTMMPMHAQALHISIVRINKLLLQHEVHSKLFLSWTDGPYFSKANTCMYLSIIQKKEFVFFM